MLKKRYDQLHGARGAARFKRILMFCQERSKGAAVVIYTVFFVFGQRFVLRTICAAVLGYIVIQPEFNRQRRTSLPAAVNLKTVGKILQMLLKFRKNCSIYFFILFRHSKLLSIGQFNIAPGFFNSNKYCQQTALF